MFTFDQRGPKNLVTSLYFVNTNRLSREFPYETRALYNTFMVAPGYENEKYY